MVLCKLLLHPVLPHLCLFVVQRRQGPGGLVPIEHIDETLPEDDLPFVSMSTLPTTVWATPVCLSIHARFKHEGVGVGEY